MQLNYLKNPIIIVKYSISHFSDTFSLTFLKYLPVGPINTRISQALTIQFSDPGPLSSQGSIRVLSLYFFTYFFTSWTLTLCPPMGFARSFRWVCWDRNCYWNRGTHIKAAAIIYLSRSARGDSSPSVVNWSSCPRFLARIRRDSYWDSYWDSYSYALLISILLAAFRSK